MNSRKFERELKTLIYYVREYGIQHLSFPLSELSRIHDDNAIAEEFITQVHKGFYFAQERIIDLLRKVINEQKTAKRGIAETRRLRNKSAEQALQAKLQSVKEPLLSLNENRGFGVLGRKYEQYL